MAIREMSVETGRRKVMKPEIRSLGGLKRNMTLFVASCFITSIAYGLPAHTQQASQSDNGAVVDQSSQGMDPASATSSRSSVVAASPQCPAVQHWEPDMGMCMPNGKAPKKTKIDLAPSSHKETASPGATPTEMPPAPPSEAADRPLDSAMNMPMSGDGKSNSGVMFHLNQFMLYSNTSGPRGQSRVTGPGMWMLMYGDDLSPENQLRIDVMGSPEQLTVGDKGTPQLLQTEHIDAMHAHDYIMALEFRDVVTLSANDNEQLTFLFAPRGEAAIGPVPFMHRESAEGNPDAPLGHALQDGFHDASTVLGMEYQFAHTTVEATAFSGQNISWPFPLHRPDSYSLRVNQKIDDHVSVGASYANALLPDDAAGAERNQFISGWLTTSYLIDNNTLKSSLIWGQGRAAHGPPLNSFLDEAVYQLGRSNFYGRAEVLQVTPQQLQLVISNGAADAKWVKALTVGYERNIFERGGLSLFVGGSYTKDFIPADFQPAYGSDPRGVKVYLRIAFDGNGL